MESQSKFKTLVVLDLETTGLIEEQPKITELAMVAVNIASLEEMKTDDELPRVLNKFVKLFNPLKLIPDIVAKLSGLNNKMLLDYAPFTRETVVSIEAFLNDLQKPICFVAHNGNPFDFPILYKEIRNALSNVDNSNEMNDNNPVNSIPNDDDVPLQTSSSSSLFSIDCADSLIFFRERQKAIDENKNESEVISTPIESISSPASGDMSVKYIPSPDPARQQPSMKLVKIYEREFKENITRLKSHRAEDDCLMLLAIIKRYLPNWIEWMEKNHQPLSNFFS